MMSTRISPVVGKKIVRIPWNTVNGMMQFLQ